MSDLISYTTIVAAKNGDADAMQRIMKHYAPYIATHAKRTFYDDFGNYCKLADEDIRQRIEAKLLYQIVTKFNPTQLPSEETIED